MYSGYWWLVTFIGWLMPLSSLGQYQVNGSASQISCNCYQLTPNATNLGGSVWNVNQIDLTNSFDYNFQVWLGCANGGADGIGFVLQPVDVNQGGAASSLGYGNIAPSLLVEIDIWPNDVTMNDPPEDHIAIMQNGDPNHGSVNNLAGPVTASATQNNIEDCSWHLIRLVWDAGLNTFTVYFDGAFRTSYTADVINTIFGGSSMVYWGWTGGTGGASADQRFCNTILPDYIVTSNSLCQGEQVTFDDASLTSSGNITGFNWDFGDGTTGTGIPITHTYNNSGTFDVSLSITTEGCSEDTVIPISIDPTPVVDLGPDVNMCIGESLQLNSSNTLGSGSYLWSPATDLSNPVAPSPTTTTTVATNYTLTYTSNNGCSASDDVEVMINQLPIVDAGVDQTICENDTAQLDASGGINYSWNPSSSLDDPLIANPNASPGTTTTYTVEVTDANNCSSSDDVSITVLPLPSLDAGQDENICEGDVVPLNAVGLGSFSWTPSLGLTNPNVANPNANPSVTTTYYVSLTDSDGCTSVDSLVIDVDAIPIADFQNPPPTCDGNAVQFMDNSVGNIVSYSWDFGDGEVGTGPNPSHLYPSIGSYTVQLTVVSNNGCSSSTVGEANVVDGPTPDVTVVNGPDLCVNEQIEILDLSTGPIASYTWDFGDGIGSANVLPDHFYLAPGFYTISLELTAPDQCSNFQYIDLEVHPLPDADFSYTTPCEDQSTMFEDQSNVLTGNVVGWIWNFGDGSDVQNSELVSHEYDEAGDYSVQLIAQTDIGCVDTTTQLINVYHTPELEIASNNSCVGDETSFSNYTPSNDIGVVHWDWQFGDGENSDDFEPIHQYTLSGSFVVQLTAVTDSGCSATTTTEIQIYPYPESEFSMSDFDGCAPLNVLFENHSTIESNYSIGSYEWYFGDGTVSNQESPSHTYVTDGVYDIGLISTTAGSSCSDTSFFPGLLTVYLTPEASFYYEPTDATIIDPRITFTNTSLNGIEYQWDFGDGRTSISANPDNLYSEEGTYAVTLTATNGICTSTISQRIRIDPVTLIYIPNSFTPNGDGLNDEFIPEGIGIEAFSMSIFDRWGKELYHTATIDEPWRGWFKNLELPNDSYVYHVQILDVKGETKSFLGNVNLIR